MGDLNDEGVKGPMPLVIGLALEEMTWLRCLAWLAGDGLGVVGWRNDADLSKRVLDGVFCAGRAVLDFGVCTDSPVLEPAGEGFSGSAGCAKLLDLGVDGSCGNASRSCCASLSLWLFVCGCKGPVIVSALSVLGCGNRLLRDAVDLVLAVLFSAGLEDGGLVEMDFVREGMPRGPPAVFEADTEVDVVRDSCFTPGRSFGSVT